MLYYNDYYKGWTRKFALFPKNIGSGMTVWFQFYYQKYVEYPSPVKCCDGCQIVGEWEYSLTGDE